MATHRQPPPIERDTPLLWVILGLVLVLFLVGQAYEYTFNKDRADYLSGKVQMIEKASRDAGLKHLHDPN